MASWYVYSGAAGAGTGADWANACTTLGAAITLGAAGDTYYVAHDHAQTQASALTITQKGTAASPDNVYCVDRAGSVPPVAADLRATASITTTGTNAITLAGHAYVEGIIFNCGTGAGTASLTWPSTGKYRNCQFNLVGTSATSTITGTNNQVSFLEFFDCTFSFGAVGQTIVTTNGVTITGPSGSVLVTGATIPTNLFTIGSVGGSILKVYGADLSASGSGKTLVAAVNRYHGAQLINCKLNASVTVSGTPTLTPTINDVIGCHSATNVARNERYAYTGTLTTETTIVRTGGASDGTTAYSWKIVPTANNERAFPFRTFDGAEWNTATGASKTLTVHVLTDNVTLTDAQIWLEVEYLGSSATPVSTLITDAPATMLTTAANQATSTEAWTTTGIGTPVYQKLECTFTPNMVGPIRWRVAYAKTSTTVYVCPKAELS